jgi:hypothetical protein
MISALCLNMTICAFTFVARQRSPDERSDIRGPRLRLKRATYSSGLRRLPLLRRTCCPAKKSSPCPAFAASPNAALKDRLGNNMMRVSAHRSKTGRGGNPPCCNLPSRYSTRASRLAKYSELTSRSKRARCFVPLSATRCACCEGWASSLPPVALFHRPRTGTNAEEFR